MGFFFFLYSVVPSERTARHSGKALNHLQPDGCGLRNNWHAISRRLHGNREAPKLRYCHCHTSQTWCNTPWKKRLKHHQHFCVLLTNNWTTVHNPPFIYIKKKEISICLIYSCFLLFFCYSHLVKGWSAALPWEGKIVMVLGEKQRTDEKAPACLIKQRSP